MAGDPRESLELWLSSCKDFLYLEVPWVVKSGVISPLIWTMTIVTLHITHLITTHEPPSRQYFNVSMRGV